MTRYRLPHPHLSPTTLNVLHVLMVGDALVLAAAGLIAFRFVDRPAGAWIAVACWIGAGGLTAALPLTDPYRRERRRRHRAAPRR